MGRLILNVLLSFAQFEREVIGERIRDKIAAQRRKGKWAGGVPVLGYEVSSQLAKEALEADRWVYELVLEKNLLSKEELDELLRPEKMIASRKTKPF